MPPRLPEAPVTPDTMPGSNEAHVSIGRETRGEGARLTVGKRVDVRDEGEVGAVAALEEEGHSGD